MNRRELIQEVAGRTGVTQDIVKQCLYSAIDVMQGALEEGEKITFRKFGTFYVKNYGERRKVDPRNQKPIIAPPKRVIKFKGASDLPAK